VLNSPSDGSERPVGNNLALFARPAPPPVPTNALTSNYQEQTGVYSHVGAPIRSATPTTNNGTAASIRVGYDTTQGKTRGVFSFDLSSIPADAIIHSVSLMLDAFDANGATGFRYVDLELFRLNTAIVENQVTWNQSTTSNNWTSPGGDFNGPSLSSLFGQQTTGMKTFVSTIDFVAAAQEALVADEPLNLLVATLDAEAWGAVNSANLQLRFRSDDATTGQRPALTVRYTYAGDFNTDGAVDAADYVVWRKTDGTPASYYLWRSHFGLSPGSGSGSAGPSPSQTAVPEPTTLVLLMFAAAGWCLRRGWAALPVSKLDNT
jgi:PEP-CTERM motif-containing protein